MKRELFLLRHGKSDWRLPVDDFHRPLKKRGRKNAKQVGGWIAGQGLMFDVVLSSPATRALQTAQIVCEAMRLDGNTIKEEIAIYEADQEDLLQIVQSVPKTAQRALLVGHNMAMEDLVAYLAGSSVEWPEDGKLMPTAALAMFQVNGSWDSVDVDAVRLIHILRPRQLGATEL